VLYFTLSGNALRVYWCFTSPKSDLKLNHAVTESERMKIGIAPMLDQRLIRTVFVFGLVAGICGCSQGSEHSSGQKSSPELRRGLGGEPASLDPAAAADTFSTQVIQDLYEGLTRETSTGEVVPGVASSWTIDSTGTKYTFRLRPNAKWSNGEPIAAQQFLTSWQRVLDPRQASPVASDLRLIVGAGAIISGKSPPTALGVTAPSPDVLIVTLERPAPYFPQLLAHSAAFPIYSESTARSHDSNTWVSNGPFVLSNWLPGTALDLRRNVEYWDRTNVMIERQISIRPGPKRPVCSLSRRATGHDRYRACERHRRAASGALQRTYDRTISGDRILRPELGRTAIAGKP